MKIKVVLGSLISFALSSIICLAADRSSSLIPEKTKTEMSFAQIVLTIDASIGEMDATEGLLGEKLFAALAAKATENVDQCLDFVSARNHSYKQKMIAVYSMHTLQVAEYLRFVAKLANLVDRGLVSRELLGLAISPGYAFTCCLIENYETPEVQEALQQIARGKNVSRGTKAAIEGILSGEALRDFRSYRAAYRRQ